MSVNRSYYIEIRADFATRRGRNYFDRFHTEIEIVAEQWRFNRHLNAGFFSIETN